MLTPRGWAVGGGALVLLVAGRILGLVELYVIGSAALFLIPCAAIGVRLMRADIEVLRAIRPEVVEAGGSAVVEVAVVNRSARPSPPLLATDSPGRSYSAELRLASVRGHSAARLAYDLHQLPRGRLEVGPMELEAGDPFGLTRLRRKIRGTAFVLVVPRTETISPPPSGASLESGAGRLANRRDSGGGDFHSLRSYVSGDDLRRVHWPSTAKRGELLVRQDETEQDSITTIALDVRRSIHDASSFERLLSAALSLCASAIRDRQTVRMVTSAGIDTGLGRGDQHLRKISELLAGVRPSSATSVSSLQNSLANQRSSGSAVVLTCSASTPNELAWLRALPRTTAAAIAVVFSTTSSQREALSFPGLAVITVGQGQSFRTVWDAAVSAPPRARVRRARA